LIEAATVASIGTKPRLSIIGGGYSGAMILANLISLSDQSICIDWFEPNIIGEGLAYKTVMPLHLLNVRSDRMGAFADNPAHFYEWVQKMHGINHTISPDSYAPRYLYGEYIKSIVAESLVNAAKKGIEVILHKATVTNAEAINSDTHAIKLTFNVSGSIKEILTDVVILATGNLPPRHHNFKKDSLLNNNASYIHDIWNLKDITTFKNQVGKMSTEDNIVLIGTGLTAIDSIVMLESFGYKGNITAISRHGLIPAKHVNARVYPAWEWTINPVEAPRSTLGMLRSLKKEIQKAKEQNYTWHSVIDSIRPVTQILWKQLSTSEKKKFLKYVSTFWGIHRHRMAPEIWEGINYMNQTGRLTLIAGKILSINSNDDLPVLSYRKRGAENSQTIKSSIIINCTGPEYNIAESNHTLLRNMLDNKLITTEESGMGISVTDTGTAIGQNNSNIFPIGSLLVGELLECTAVPELRQQALQTAKSALKYANTISAVNQ